MAARTTRTPGVPCVPLKGAGINPGGAYSLNQPHGMAWDSMGNEKRSTKKGSNARDLADFDDH